MLRLLDEKNLLRLENKPSPGWPERRIRALAKAHGAPSSLARFYADKRDRAFLSFEKDLATLSLSDPTFQPEVEDFLCMTAGEVLSSQPLKLPGFSEEAGNSYETTGFPPHRLEGVTEHIQDAYDLLSRIFPETINSSTHAQWYCDLSHRVRHGMSQVYTLPGICSGTLYAVENATVADACSADIALLAVAPERLREGWGRAMLSHLVWAAAESVSPSHPSPHLRLHLNSQNSGSDRFYEHLGFQCTGHWYLYRRQQE